MPAGNMFGEFSVLLMILLVSGVSCVVHGVGEYHQLALPDCADRCGNIVIPYPFGVDYDTEHSKTSNCSHNSWFSITCNKFYSPPKPFLRRLVWTHILPEHKSFYSPPYYYEDPGSEVTAITFGSDPARNSVSTRGSFDTMVLSGHKVYEWKRLVMEGSPFRLMGEGRNALVVGGCSGGAVVVRDRKNETVVGCATACIKNANPSSRPNKTCYGLECCQSVIPTFHDFVEMNFLNFVKTNESEPVSAVLVDLAYMKDKRVDRNLSEFKQAPMLLQWQMKDLEVNSPQYANSLCVKEKDGGYTCTCRRDYFRGNPYLPNGCQVIKVCEECPENCTSLANNKFYCPKQLPQSNKSMVMKLALGFGIPLATMCMLIILFLSYQLHKKRKEVLKKKRNFKRNGGLLLHQHAHTSDNSIERTKLFTADELEKATNEFSENRVLGRGGQGTVYKGMLVDGTIVAVKKSKKVSETQLQQFVNEVVILSQVNHRNVVRLFGCCLETDVPLLVYEYVPNGTLYQHLHNPYEDFRITWKMRLQIATESAEALAYLHSGSFAPIYHRDVKTSNILLDEKYKAKVADFGTSKTLSLDQTHDTTHVQGTIGYMDPEFLQSSQFTEKSDVYSFGIVIVELLTSKKAIFLDNPEEHKSLASEFLDLMKSSRLYDLVDSQVLEEAEEKEIASVADLARECLNLDRKQRPTMKQVVMTLQMIKSQNTARTSSSEEFITRNEMNVDHMCTRNGGFLSTSSSYGPR